MKLTQQEEIGLRCMIQMARMPRGDTLAIPEIAEREALTTAYVAKLMRLLRLGGLVQSIRGQKGGYELTRAPEAIPVSEILAALGQPVHRPEVCRDDGVGGQACVHQKNCSIRALRWGIDRLVGELMSQCTLADLLAGERTVKRRLKAHIEGQGAKASPTQR